MHVNVIFSDPETGYLREIQEEFTAMPRAGEVIFFPHVEHCLRQVVKQVAYVVTPDGKYGYLVLEPDPDQTLDEVWSAALR
jgi:hypothetical protein